MIATILWKFLFRNNFTSALTGAAMIMTAAYTWHVLDKNSGIKQAVVRFVAATELAAAEARADELQKIIEATREANRLLQEGIRHAEADAAAWELEIQRYVDENEINPSGLVDADLHRRLRAN